VGLALVLFVIGLAVVGGALTALVPSSFIPDTFRPLPLYVGMGSEGSVVGAVFGLGLIWAALKPGGKRLWVHLAILYAILVLAREAILANTGKSPSLGPILFGVASLALLLALYPGFGRKPTGVPPVAVAPPPTKAADAAPVVEPQPAPPEPSPPGGEGKTA
jgi:hypothetical protein